MNIVYANNITNDNGVTHGHVVLDKTVQEDLQIIFSENRQRIIKDLLKNSPHGFYFFDRFCQLIVLVVFDTELGLSMKISDFKNDIDLALDEYSYLKSKGWNESSRNKIMNLFQLIQDDPGSIAEIVIKDPFP